MADKSKTTETQKLTGKLKWLDAQGFGYILPDNPFFPEVFVCPSSLSSDIIQEGDCVKFGFNFCGSNPPHSAEAINVVPYGSKCNSCKRFGHISFKCPEKSILKVKCFRCGLIGHHSKDCDQKFSGRFSNKTHKKGSFVNKNKHCSGWSSLFGDGGRAHNGGVGFGLGSTSVVCVKKRKDVKKVEEVEDCFILEFDPTLDDDDDDDDDDVRSIVCVKKVEDVKKVEEVEDCFILEFDPTVLDKFSNMSIFVKSEVVDDEDDDLSILAEKGKVACRDYPHSRHLCAIYPFKKTPHYIHCKMCYCYICDIPAPCKKWNIGSDKPCSSHCDATDESLSSKILRDLEKRQT